MFDRMMAARRTRQREGGQVLVLFTLLLVVLLLASALAVDYGAWLVTKRSYQNVADAAALAGAQQLTRSLTAGKRSLAREAAWQAVKSDLNLTLDPAAQAGADEATAYTENGYSIWVASPPEDANAGCSSNCPYPGHVSGPGVVFVRVQRAGQHFLSRIAFSTDTPVVAWATAGRFPQNFAVEAMCDPNAGGGNCIVQGANIKIDGNNSLLAVSTGDLGTNSWTRTSGSGSAIGLGTDSNAYMGTFEDCWDANGNQCNLYTYSGGAVDYSSARNASPLGAQIVNPNYPAPTIDATATPNQCKGAGTVQLASLLESGSDGRSNAPAAPAPDIDLAAAQLPPTPAAPQLGAPKPQISGTVQNSSGTALSGISISAVSGGNTYTDTTSAAGVYTLKNVNAGTYTITATDTVGVYHGGTTSVTVAATDVTAPLITLQKNPVISGTIRDASTSTGISGVTVTITGVNLGGSWTGTTNGSGAYSIIVTNSDQFSVAGAKAGYISSSGHLTGGVVAYDGTSTVSFNLTPSPASLAGTITDAVTGLGIQGIVVTLAPGGATATTNTSGSYNFASVSQGTYTATLSGVNMSTLSGLWGSGTAIDGYMTGAPSSPATPLANLSVIGATTQNFQLWPKGCSSNAGNYGNWSCSYPSGSNCPATTNRDASNVTCTFTQANAIRPGTYKDITINGCAWIDPKGGPSGLPSGQSAGIVHVKGTLSMSNNSYLFGDGVTIVMDQAAKIDVNNGGGFVLNFGSLHSTAGDPTTSCDLSSIKDYGDGYSPCFRTPPSTDTADYAYAAWTSKGHDPWACSGTQASPPAYSTSCVNVGQELGVTWYLYGTPSGAGKRFSLSTANMGYLFNGVLYGPNDNIELGGGKDGQSAAGQIVGYTIEYHGGTKIIQRWYGDPVDGPPFLIEPILGECVVPVNVCS
ncbi:MAG TPA: carboxypeptidase-like regulatory domain-containing protein [Candidatus Limnocylindrales bacterium]|jgi:hypothetical protein